MVIPAGPGSGLGRLKNGQLPADRHHGPSVELVRLSVEPLVSRDGRICAAWAQRVLYNIYVGHTLFCPGYEWEILVCAVPRTDHGVLEIPDLTLADVTPLNIGRDEVQLMPQSVYLITQSLRSRVIHNLLIDVPLVEGEVAYGRSEGAQEFGASAVRHPFRMCIIVEAYN
jgi:hypothetical protein